MCGIAGYISKDKNFFNEKKILNLLNLMKRRGPDNQSFKKINKSTTEIGLLHSRLNIIDLHPRSNQPFELDGYIIVFNGEIYNFLEIKKELEKKYKFFTNSDTEILLKSYILFGEKCVDNFEGMWSFAIWDPNNNVLFLSRDPFGEKPLYYTLLKDKFIFGSEVKYIKTLIGENLNFNKELINKNLFLGYKSIHKNNHTFFENIFSLNNGENFFIDLQLKTKKKTYWFPKLEIDQNISYEEAVNETYRLICNSLKLRLRADVPIAFCLSGGIDSSLLASISKNVFNKDINTFSIFDSDERYNELENIKIMNKDLNSNYTIIDITKLKSNFLERLNTLTAHHDSPIATISYYLHSFLTENISKKFRVSISGLGADEIFTGYYDHYLSHLASIKNYPSFEENLLNWKNYILPFVRNDSFKDSNKYIDNPNNREGIYETKYGLNQFSTSNFSYEFKEVKFCNEILRNRMFNEINFETLPPMLRHDDLNSMFYSIENRSPYLDKQLYNFSLKVSPDHLIKKGFQKKLLRDAGLNILNDKIRLSRQKKGFNASINSCLDFQDKKLINFMYDTKSPINEFVNVKKMKENIQLNHIENHISKYLFSFISTKFFLGDKI